MQGIGKLPGSGGAVKVIYTFLFLQITLTGCAQDPPAAPIAPKTVSVTSTDFCEIMKAIAPPLGKPTWSRNDTPETITNIRRLNAAVDKRCASPAPAPSS